MKILNSIFFLFCLSLLLTSCYENENKTTEPEVVITPTEILINADLNGAVTLLNGELMSDYQLEINNQLFDVEGTYFSIKVENAKKKGQSITVLKEGKKVGFFTALLIENDINQVDITSHGYLETATISDLSQRMDINGLFSVDYSSVVWESGYTGAVEVNFTNIDQEIDLTAIAYTPELHVLAVDGQGGFFLTTVGAADNQILTPSEGNKIKIHLDNISNRINGLFEFDNDREIWILVQNVTKGDVVSINATGYYCFGNYEKGVFVDGLVTVEGKPVAYQQMYYNHNNLENRFRSSEKGRWITTMPENESVELDLQNVCDESIFSSSITVESSDLFNEEIDVINDNGNFQYLDVSIFDCHGGLVDNPQVVFESGSNSNQYLFSNSTVQTWIATCDNININAVTETNAGPDLPIGEILEDLDIISNCDEYKDGYSYIKIYDEEKIYAPFEIRSENGETIITGQDKFRLRIRGTEQRTYENEEVNIFIDDEEFGSKGYFIACENSTIGCGITTCELERFGNNEFAKVTFSGSLWMQSLNPSIAQDYPITGEIIIRVQ